MEIYTLGWWEFIGKRGRTWEWQEIPVMAYNEIHMISQINEKTIKKIEKGLEKGTILGVIYHSRKPTFLEKLIYI